MSGTTDEVRSLRNAAYSAQGKPHAIPTDPIVAGRKQRTTEGASVPFAAPEWVQEQIAAGGGEEAATVVLLPASAPMLPAAGAFLTTAVTGILSSYSQSPGRHTLVPWVSPYSFDVDGLGIGVTNIVGGAQAKITVYEADENGRPAALLHETAAFDCSTVATHIADGSFSFEAGRLYWFGLRSSANPGVRTPQNYAAFALAWSADASPTPLHTLVDYHTFADPAPALWSYSNTHLASHRPPLIFMRVA